MLDTFNGVLLFDDARLVLIFQLKQFQFHNPVVLVLACQLLFN